jgi:hemin uptake protein HemP
MIISFRNQFIFVAVPKTGSQALRLALRPFLAANDWEQCTLFDTRFFPVERLAAIGHGHITWRDVQPFLLPGQWEAMTSFAVVRCPYSRFASLARFAFRDHGALPPDHINRLKAMLNDPIRRGHILLRPQHHFVCDHNGTVRTSMLLRHEELAEAMDQLSARLDLSLPPLERVNPSPKGLAFAPDAELLELIRHLYADDFRIFGYDADNPRI